ncbi:2-dehydro-3-deoxygalactonokinase [Rhodoferax sp. GW822-FHT02A01]|uniref:2-dehydro-3-deoxygalactonokinase n=1 Tax=Rhodoferax sp. GW822-FHT02A01 TaxID=3141537 RepID=UPI00315CC3CF
MSVSEMPQQLAMVGVDWGTTHRRAYALNDQGQCLRTHADGEGALASKGRFEQALVQALQALDVDTTQVVMSGMVGSALGWVQVPYVDESVLLTDLAKHLYPVPAGRLDLQAVIVPGYCVRDSHGQPDVMRGEETQLLGAVTLGHHSGWFVLPGTHSKWVELRAGRIQQLRTYMTGELFDLLSKQGTIAAAIGAEEASWDQAAFADGVQASAQGSLSHLLFGCRARVVCGDMVSSSARAYLSGLLIGHEMHDVLGRPGATSSVQDFYLIGSPALATLYRASAEQLGLHCHLIDAEQAFIGALSHLQTHWKNT